MKDPKHTSISEEDQKREAEHSADDRGDFERQLSAVGRLMDETWRVCRREQARNDGHLQKRQFELEDRVEHLKSDVGDDA